MFIASFVCCVSEDDVGGIISEQTSLINGLRLSCLPSVLMMYRQYELLNYFMARFIGSFYLMPRLSWGSPRIDIIHSLICSRRLIHARSGCAFKRFFMTKYGQQTKLQTAENGNEAKWKDRKSFLFCLEQSLWKEVEIIRIRSCFYLHNKYS